MLAALALLGGGLYPPANFDGLAYRTPRVLNWLAAERWVWVPDFRGWLNTRACAFEWVTAPVLLFCRTDRPIFLINIISFLLLPGLAFGLLTRCGLRARAAWHWMWLLPSGYCFLLQSGSIGNDLFGAVFALAAVDFALRARVSGRPADAMYSVLAAALMTGSKVSNLVLLLPWVIAMLPGWRLFLRHKALTWGTAALSAWCSYLPTAWNNHRHGGDWSAQSIESAFQHPPNMPIYFARTAVLLTTQNFTPPVWPWAEATERFVQRALPTSFKNWLAREQTSPTWSHFAFRELAGEEEAGWGFGLSMLVLVSVLGPGRRTALARLHAPGPAAERWWRAVLLLAPFGSLAVFMGKAALTTAARTIAPFYGLLLPALLFASGIETQVRKRWWRGLAVFVFVSAAVAVILIPERPLWPAQTVLAGLSERFHSPALARAATVYRTYRDRSTVLAPLVRELPPTERVVGLLGITEPETTLWRPFGARRVVHVLAGTSPTTLRNLGITYVFANAGTAESVLQRPLPAWLEEFHGSVVTNISLRVFASGPPDAYAVIKLHAPAATASEAQPGTPGRGSDFF